MYGRNIGTLNVYSKATMLGSLATARWTMVGAQGDQWRKGEFTVLESNAVVRFIGSTFSLTRRTIDNKFL